MAHIDEMTAILATHVFGGSDSSAAYLRPNIHCQGFPVRLHRRHLNLAVCAPTHTTSINLSKGGNSDLTCKSADPLPISFTLGWLGRKGGSSRRHARSRFSEIVCFQSPNFASSLYQFVWVDLVDMFIIYMYTYIRNNTHLMSVSN